VLECWSAGVLECWSAGVLVTRLNPIILVTIDGS
jgi:hypothetical protein